MSLVLGSPEMDTVLQLWPHQCLVEGKDHLPQSAGNTLSNAAQDTVKLFLPPGHIAASCSMCYPSGIPGPLLKSCLPSSQPPEYTGAASTTPQHVLWRLFLTGCRTSYFPVLNSMRFLSAVCSRLLRSLWMAEKPFGMSAPPPALCHP